jgi:4'-phosphopantetheinyl transferase
MIISDIQSEKWQVRNIDEPDYFGSDILHKPALFIIRSEDFSVSELQRFRSLLTPWERGKSQRFIKTSDRNSYILVHGLLRSLLSNPLGLPPDCIKFRYNQYGKPYVTGTGTNIFFNMSHSSDISVIGVDPVSEIGVDVEKINENVDYKPIINHFFTCNEISYIQEQKGKSVRRFYELWTRKEAFLKALGIGITENLSVDVSGNADVKLGNPSDRRNNPEKFQLKTVSFKDKYIVSIASVTGSGKINVFRMWK